jgi:hypothetical protein
MATKSAARLPRQASPMTPRKMAMLPPIADEAAQLLRADGSRISVIPSAGDALALAWDLLREASLRMGQAGWSTSR